MYFCSVETEQNLHPAERYMLGKSYKLRHKTLVDRLFANGESLYQFPLRFTYKLLSPNELSDSFRDVVPDRIGPVQILITVPKKKLRHAVDRVLMRRRIREALRLRLPELKNFIAQKGGDVRTMSVAVIYLDKELSSSRRIREKLNRILSKLFDEKVEEENIKGESEESGD